MYNVTLLRSGPVQVLSEFTNVHCSSAGTLAYEGPFATFLMRKEAWRCTKAMFFEQDWLAGSRKFWIEAARTTTPSAKTSMHLNDGGIITIGLDWRVPQGIPTRVCTEIEFPQREDRATMLKPK